MTTQVPFVRGGAEVLADGLAAALRQRGHDPEILGLPFTWSPTERLLDSVMAARLTRIASAEVAVTMKFPSYYVPHHHKNLWLVHQHRPAHDLWRTPWGGLPPTAEGAAAKDAIVRADRAWLAESSARFAISGVVAGRLRASTGLDATVLAPPLPPRSRPAPVGPYGDYLLMHGRIAPLKRQALAIAAMRHVNRGLRLVIAGTAASPAELWRLRALAARHGVAHRISMTGRWLAPSAMEELLAGARAALCLGFDEDYGLVALEAAAAARPVITCHDAGAIAEFVIDGETGLVADPEPEALAAAINAIGSPAGAARAGSAAAERLEALGLSWDHVVEQLLR